MACKRRPVRNRERVSNHQYFLARPIRITIEEVVPAVPKLTIIDNDYISYN
jgi:hypothetical protein